MKRKGSKIASLPLVEPNAAGADIGATQIFVAVPADRDAEPVRCFDTFTADLERLADWLDAYKMIVLCVRWYLRFGLSYRNLEEMMAERNLSVDHVTIWRWVQC